MCLASLPTRERGLKFVNDLSVNQHNRVAPYTGAWIEISARGKGHSCSDVAPYTGAWIEMSRL